MLAAGAFYLLDGEPEKPGNATAGGQSEPPAVPETREAPKPPKLLAPADGETLPNGTADRQKNAVWDFEWEDVPHAGAYELYVVRPGGEEPEELTKTVEESQFRYERGFVPNALAKGWLWTVRARVGRRWSNWSPMRSFEVALLEGDETPPETPLSIEEWIEKDLLPDLRSPDPDRLSSAMTRFPRLGKVAIPWLTRETVSPRGTGHAAQALAQLGPDAEEAIPQLIEALKGPRREMHIRVVPVLAAIGPAAHESLPLLMEFLTDDETEPGDAPSGDLSAKEFERLMFRLSVARAVWQISGDPKPALPVLIESIRAGSLHTVSACEFLAEMTDLGADGVDAVEPLINVLKTFPARSNGSISAARALGNIGPAAKAAIPELKRAAAGESPSLKAAAEEALRKIEAR